MLRPTSFPLTLAISAWLCSCGAPPETVQSAPPLVGLEDLLVRQTELYPLMMEADMYKLVYQATRGPSHVFMGRDSELDIGLNEEIAEMKPAPAEGVETVEMLDPERNLARINLRPFLLEGGKASDLARAVAETAHRFRGDMAVFRASLDEAAGLIPLLNVGFSAKDFQKHVAKMKEQGFPPGVHSRAYALTYEPAYRIVQLQYLTDQEYGGRYDG